MRFRPVNNQTFHSTRMAPADAGACRRFKEFRFEERKLAWVKPTLTELVDTETLQIINDFIILYGAHTFGGLVGYGRCFGHFDRAEVQALVSARWLVRDERKQLRRFDGGPFEDE